MTKKRRPAKDFTGVLLERMTAPDLLQPLESEARYYGEIIERWKALRAHYGLEPSNMSDDTSLWMALARDFVPGFEMKKRPGRRPDPGSAELDLMVFVEGQKAEEGGRSVNGAMRHLAARLSRDGEPVNESTLRKRYYTLLHGGDEATRMVRLLRLIQDRDPK